MYCIYHTGNSGVTVRVKIQTLLQIWHCCEIHSFLSLDGFCSFSLLYRIRLFQNTTTILSFVDAHLAYLYFLLVMLLLTSCKCPLMCICENFRSVYSQEWNFCVIGCKYVFTLIDFANQQFSKVKTFPSAVDEDSCFSTYLSILGIDSFFKLAILNGMQQNFIVVLICIS